MPLTRGQKRKNERREIASSSAEPQDISGKSEQQTDSELVASNNPFLIQDIFGAESPEKTPINRVRQIALNPAGSVQEGAEKTREGVVDEGDVVGNDGKKKKTAKEEEVVRGDTEKVRDGTKEVVRGDTEEVVRGEQENMEEEVIDGGGPPPQEESGDSERTDTRTLQKRATVSKTASDEHILENVENPAQKRKRQPRKRANVPEDSSASDGSDYDEEPAQKRKRRSRKGNRVTEDSDSESDDAGPDSKQVSPHVHEESSEESPSEVSAPDQFEFFPNELMTRDGHTNAFRYELLCGEEVVLTHLDLYHTSLERYATELVVSVGGDVLLRDNSCTPDDGWQWVHETQAITKYLKNSPVSEKEIPLNRLESFLTSKVLFIPIHVENSAHWSLLVLVNVNTIFEVAMKWKPKDGLLTKSAIPKNKPKPLAVHFDSFPGSGHFESSRKVKSLLSNALVRLWKKNNPDLFRRKRMAPSVTSLLSSISFVKGNAEEQQDAVTCGWRTVDNARFIMEHKSHTPTNWEAISKKEVRGEHVEVFKRVFRMMQEKSSPKISDIPSVMFPAHFIVDEVCCSQFDADMSNINHRLVTYFDDKCEEDDANTRGNRKKQIQGRKFDEVYAKVASEMQARGLHNRKKMNRTSPMTSAQCKKIAQIVFHYPRGPRYASCIYYTRYNYPCSLLVCQGVNLTINKTARIFGHDISSGCPRVRKSGRVHYQMGVFLDWKRSRAHNWDVNARFRLQEMMLHFIGIAETLLMSCCREAKIKEDNDCATGLEKVGGEEESDDGSVEKIEEDSEEWSFEGSIAIESGSLENGRICSSVSPSTLGAAISTCLYSADEVANLSILSCLMEFESHCKKVLKLSNPKTKLSDVGRIVTASSLASIHGIFSRKFSSVLLEKIKSMWGHRLNDAFMNNSVKPLLDKLLRAADNFFTRNGRTFLNLDEASNFLQEAVPPSNAKKTSLRKSTGLNVVQDSTPAVSEEDDEEADLRSLPANAASQTVPARVTSSIGLALRSLFCGPESTEKDRNELFALVLYLVQGCRSHQRCEELNCAEWASQKWGSALPECQIRLQSVWSTFKAAVNKLRQDYSKLVICQETRSFEAHCHDLMFDMVVRAASSITDTRDPSAQHRSLQCSSKLFCYELPSSHRGDGGVKHGKEFFFYSQDEMETAIWHAVAVTAECDPVGEQESGISIAAGRDGRALIGPFPIDAQDAPKLFYLNMRLQIKCSVDLWTGSSEIEGAENCFLGFSRYDVVAVTLSFHDGKGHSGSSGSPFSGIYSHSFPGVVLNITEIEDIDNGDTKGRRRGRNRRFVGPRLCDVQLMVHDDIVQASGSRCTLQDLVKRWRDGDIRYKFIYVMKLHDLSLEQVSWQYVNLKRSRMLPKNYMLTFLDATMADAYEDERRKLDYEVMRMKSSGSEADRLSFPSLHDLEARHKEEIRNAARACDRRLNDGQVGIIKNVLYGCKSRLAPNSTVSLCNHSREAKDFLTNSGFLSLNDLRWWGSRSCFVQGPPGTGKTRMLAALIAVILEQLDGKPRVLVGCETNNALDDIILAVLQLFKTQKAVYKRVHNSIVRIGHSKVHIVKEREVHAQQGRGNQEVDKARAVFTTFGSSYRWQLQTSQKPFDFVIFEESCLIREETAIHFLVTACCRPRQSGANRLFHDDNFKRVVWLSIGDNNQLHDMETTRPLFERRVRTHFFDRVWNAQTAVKAGTRMGLTEQYIMNPALASFISKQFYGGRLVTPAEGDLRWKDDGLFRNLRIHAEFPVRNVTVIDTSLEENAGFETVGAGRSYFNELEAKVIETLLKAWSAAVDLDDLCKRVTIVTTYARQRDLIRARLRNINHHVKICTVDELQGGENDIIIASLVRAQRISINEAASSGAGSKIGFVSKEERINVALSRARQGVVVIGFVRHIASQSTVWRSFFKECKEKCRHDDPQGTHAYYRLRYVDFDADLHLAPFAPPYLA